jgi:ribonucleoside-diphosphate reductase alpha chain
MSSLSFCVIKRNGSKEEVSFDKVTRRIKKLCDGLTQDLNPILIAQKVCSQIYNNVSTVELDELTAQICISMETTHLDYGILASRIIISNNHKSTSPSLSETIYRLYNNKDINNQQCSLIANDVYDIIMKNKDKLNAVINYDRDYLFDYFGFKTLEKAYLMKIGGKIVERIQHLFMRVSIGIHKEDLKSAIQSYELMSQKYFIHATPTLYHSGTPRPYFASCFLLGMGDSVKGIYKTIGDCAEISAGAGGIGLSLSKIRSKNSYIRGANGYSNGIIPLCRVLNETARHINQAGKRPGSIAVYIEPHNVEILEFLELRKNTGAESERARDLFLALWISDLFMKRVESDAEWSLFDADECRGLDDSYGEEFEELYLRYERENKMRKTIPARKIWNYILTSQIETGTPYVLFKDNVNKKSNQKNVGVITNSNLCVAEDTMILTDNGYYKIKDLVGKEVNVWNGEQFSKTTVMKTGKDQKLIKVQFSDGMEIECTEYHKFHIDDNILIDDVIHNFAKKIDAKNLKLGMNILQCNFPILDLPNYDGVFRKLCPGSPLSGQALQRSSEEESFLEGKNNFVPINYSIKIKLNWLEEVLKNNQFIESNNREFLVNVKLMFQTLGCNLEIKNNLINLSDMVIDKLISLGLKFKKKNKSVDDIQNCFQLCNFFNFESITPVIRVSGIIDENKKGDTYCFTEPLRNMGIFNGVLAGNCAEIVEYSSDKEYAVCTLASISLPNFVVKTSNKEEDIMIFDHQKLIEVTNAVIRNLNKIIDVNHYSVPETELSNKRHRPLGLGVQGLADVFAKMGLPFDSPEAKKLNRDIFETLYYGAMVTSNQLALETEPYSTFKGSPLSEGKFQFDMWNIQPSDRYDWSSLRQKIMKEGVANSLLIALMPTASTSQILGNNECFEPITSNMYTRRTMAGDFIVINKYLVKDLMQLGLWNVDMKNEIIANNGSVQNIGTIPSEIKNLYKTVWEIKQKVLIDQSIDRGPFICQTQSLNLFFEEPNHNMLTSAFFHGWKNGLKTGSYYIRTRPKAQAQQFTIDPTKRTGETKYEVCETCSA